MKYIVYFTFFILFANQVFSQKWTKRRAFKEDLHKFEYSFSFKEEEFSKNHEIFRKTGDNELIFRLFDKNLDTIRIANIEITNIKEEIIQKSISNFDGSFKTKLDSGYYKVYLHGVGFLPYKFDIKLDENESLELEINLDFVDLPIIYQINAMKRLKPKEIKEIINCVKENRKTDYSICCKKGEFYIVMQL